MNKAYYVYVHLFTFRIIFFSDYEDFWYTYTLPHSTPESLHLSKSLKMNISDFAIDYLLDKLYWITSQDGNYSLCKYIKYLYQFLSILKEIIKYKIYKFLYFNYSDCADIVGSNESIDLQNISLIENLRKYAKNLVVFNSTFYWAIETKYK